MMKTPEHWSHRGLAAAALLPLAPVWWAGTKLRTALAAPYRAPVPVICVGNLTAAAPARPRLSPGCSTSWQRVAERLPFSHAVMAAAPLARHGLIQPSTTLRPAGTSR